MINMNDARRADPARHPAGRHRPAARPHRRPAEGARATRPMPTNTGRAARPPTASSSVSGIAKGRIDDIDTAAAEKAPGVLLVMTHKNVPKQGAKTGSTNPQLGGDGDQASRPADRARGGRELRTGARRRLSGQARLRGRQGRVRHGLEPGQGRQAEAAERHASRTPRRAISTRPSRPPRSRST